jgi:hypothetical protein
VPNRLTPPEAAVHTQPLREDTRKDFREVLLSDFNRVGCTTKGAYGRARRRAGVDAVTDCAVSDLSGFLAPTLATPAARSHFSLIWDYQIFSGVATRPFRRAPRQAT